MQYWSSGLRIVLKLASVLGVVSCVALFAGSAFAVGALPDGRTWEMVSPLEKNVGDILGIGGDSLGGVVQAAADGDSVTYVSLTSFGATQSAPIGNQFVAQREGLTGWSSRSINIPVNAQSFPPVPGVGVPFRAFAPDLSVGLVWSGPNGPHGFFEGPALAGAPAEYEDYYLDQLRGSSLQPVMTRMPSRPANEFKLEFLGATEDLTRAIFRSPAVLGTTGIEVEGGHNLYEWERESGQFQPLNILPGGTEEAKSEVLFGGANGAREWAVSEDGSKVVWTAETAPSTLFVREGVGTSHPVTVQVDAPAGSGRFRAATNDGSKIFFTDTLKLTADSTASEGGFGDLYRFEPEGLPGHRLADLTVDPIDPGGAEILGVLGTSTDGSYVYFVANGVLGSDPRALHGNCAPGSSPAGAQCNLYLWHEGWATPRFVARLSGEDEFEEEGAAALGAAYDWSPSLDVRTARVSPSGNRVVFMSEESLTGYDNTVSKGSSCRPNFEGSRAVSALCEEVFLYEASTDSLKCVSCNPTGARPTGPSGIPGGTQISNTFALYRARVLSEEGIGSERAGGRVRLFFDSADGLVESDTNGVEDVYEYENGNLYLISGGTDAEGASFVDASRNGSDVFFVTRKQLVAQDTDQLVDLYDARAPHVAGERVGFPVSSLTPCEGEDCRPSSSAVPLFGTLVSYGFTGAGNVRGVEQATGKASAKAVGKGKHKRPRRRVRRAKRKKGKRTRISYSGRGRS